MPGQPFRFEDSVPLFASDIPEIVRFQKTSENPQLNFMVQGEPPFLRPFKNRFPVTFHFKNAVVSFYQLEGCVVAFQPTA